MADTDVQGQGTTLAMQQHREYVQNLACNLPAAERIALLVNVIQTLASDTEAFKVLPTLLRMVKDWRVVPHEVFEELMRARPADALEMVLIARDPDEGDAWVYMTKRPSNDPHYAGLLHVPGSILRTLEDVRDVAKRLQSMEFPFMLPKRVNFVDLHMNHDTRGSCLGLIYYGDVGVLPEDRTNWYRVRDLDRSKLCIHHGMVRGIVDKAVAAWRTGELGDYMVIWLTDVRVTTSD